MVWALDLDDFNNVCKQGAYPLMTTIQSILGPASKDMPSIIHPPELPPPPPSVEVPSIIIDRPDGTKHKPSMDDKGGMSNFVWLKKKTYSISTCSILE